MTAQPTPRPWSIAPERLFPSVQHDTAIARTFRWLLDMDAPDVIKTELSLVYHAYAVLDRPERRAYASTLPSHTRYSTWTREYRKKASVLESYTRVDTILRKDGKPRTKAIKHFVRVQNENGYWTHRRVDTGERKPVTRRTEWIRWIGLSASDLLKALTPHELDRALAMMERLATCGDDKALTYFQAAKATWHENPDYDATLNFNYADIRTHRYVCHRQSVRRDDRDPIDERALAKRWLDRINAEITRRDSAAHAA